MRDVFQEAALKHLRLKNRLVRSATQDPFGAADGSVTAGQLELYRSISAGGTGRRAMAAATSSSTSGKS